ncbi:MAG: hypothetical protein KGZ83_11975 [Sulfuricella sp.]|nr:hypothetical protein [Sulfuricella sp.]
MKRQLISLSALALLLSGPAFSATSTTATATTTKTPAAVTSSSVSAAVAALNFSTTCSSGGTRVSTGTWDATSGALALSSTVAACVVSNGETHDGTRTLSGTLLLDSTTTYSVDITVKESFTVTRDGATQLQHTCTLTRKGSFDSTTDRFTGTVTRNNCTDTGEVWDHQHGIESLLRDSQVIDVPQPPSGTTPPQRGPGGGGHQGPGMMKPTTGTTTTSSTSTATTGN